MKKTLVVMAAGMGSRFGGLKQLNKFGRERKTLLDFAIEDAVRAGFSQAVFVIRRDIEEQFRSEVSKKHEGELDVAYAFQSLDDLPPGFAVPEGRSRPWGTGQAVLACEGIVKNPFLAINADDYYGRSAYRTMGDFLDSAEPRTYALAGYKLGNTLSKNGGVSRGICSVDSNGMLKSVDEHYGLSECGGAVIDSSGARFSKDALVSMNFWAFDTSLFGILREKFERFLRENPGDAKAEFYLPFAVGEAADEGDVKVRVIPNSELWQGITYREDVAEVEKFLEENR